MSLSSKTPLACLHLSSGGGDGRGGILVEGDFVGFCLFILKAIVCLLWRGKRLSRPQETWSKASTLLHSLPEARPQVVLGDILFHCFVDQAVHAQASSRDPGFWGRWLSVDEPRASFSHVPNFSCRSETQLSPEGCACLRLLTRPLCHLLIPCLIPQSWSGRENLHV